MAGAWGNPHKDAHWVGGRDKNLEVFMFRMTSSRIPGMGDSEAVPAKEPKTVAYLGPCHDRRRYMARTAYPKNPSPAWSATIRATSSGRWSGTS